MLAYCTFVINAHSCFECFLICLSCPVFPAASHLCISLCFACWFFYLFIFIYLFLVFNFDLNCDWVHPTFADNLTHDAWNIFKFIWYFTIFSSAAYFVVFVVLHSLSRYTRSRISFSPPEGRMHALWKSREAEMLSSSRFAALSTFTPFVCSTQRRPTSWSSLFLQVCCWLKYFVSFWCTELLWLIVIRSEIFVFPMLF